jgi:hypothetical protein
LSQPWFSAFLQMIRTRKRTLTIVLAFLILTIAISLTAYESWRSSVQSQIQSRIDLMNSGDLICSYVVSNSFVMPYYEGKVIFIEGGLVNKTQLSDWQSIANYAYTMLNNNRTQPGCKIWLGLTRTLFVVLGSHSRERVLRHTGPILREICPVLANETGSRGTMARRLPGTTLIMETP